MGETTIIHLSRLIALERGLNNVANNVANADTTGFRARQLSFQEHKPDLGSVDALKRTLLAAKPVVLGDPAAGGGAGVYTAGLMERLGLAADIKARTRLVKSGTEVAEAVAKGEAEIGIGVASDAAIVPGLDAFPLPPEAQSYSVYVAGISSGSKQVETAKALIVFLTSPCTLIVWHSGLGFSVHSRRLFRAVDHC